jgi:hypothetical protein
MPTPGPRRLILVDADMVQAYGDDFVASRWLFEGLLNFVDNKTHHYITSVNVTAQQAHALADAIAAVPLATFPVALAIHGDPTGQGVQALVRFLRQGDVLLVDGDSLSA